MHDYEFHEFGCMYRYACQTILQLLLSAEVGEVEVDEVSVGSGAGGAERVRNGVVEIEGPVPTRVTRLTRLTRLLV